MILEATDYQVDRLLRTCERRNIRLSAGFGRLDYDAPEGALDDEFKAELVACKSRVITRLAFTVEMLGSWSMPPPWPPRPAELANWPVDRRERWGHRTNELIDQGLGWREAERQAFLEIQKSIP